MELRKSDIEELRHLSGGGKWCLDGRKERRLKRLGLIEPNFGGFGWQTTQAGREAIESMEGSGATD